MKVFLKPVLAALLGFGALVGAQTSHALPTCASAGITSVTAPGSVLVSPVMPTGCLEISQQYGRAYPSWESDGIAAAFLESLALRWGGSGSDWACLGGKDFFEGNLSPVDVFGYRFSEGTIPPDSESSSTGSFSINVALDPSTVHPGLSNDEVIAQIGVGKSFELVVLLKVGVQQISNPGGSTLLNPADANGDRDPTVYFPPLAYLHSNIGITREGTLVGTFDFGDPLNDDEYFVPTGVNFFGRVVTATNPGGGGNGGTGVPEPAGLALVLGAGAAVAFSRRRRTV